MTWLITSLVQSTFSLCLLTYRGKDHWLLWAFSVIQRNKPKRDHGHVPTAPRALRTPALLGMKSLVLSGFLVVYAKGISSKHVFIFKLGFFLKFGFISRHHNPNIHVRMNTCSDPDDLNRKPVLPWQSYEVSQKTWSVFSREKYLLNSTFSQRESTVPAWIIATCSSFLKF